MWPEKQAAVVCIRRIAVMVLFLGGIDITSFSPTGAFSLASVWTQHFPKTERKKKMQCCHCRVAVVQVDATHWGMWSNSEAVIKSICLTKLLQVFLLTFGSVGWMLAPPFWGSAASSLLRVERNGGKFCWLTAADVPQSAKWSLPHRNKEMGLVTRWQQENDSKATRKY